MTHGLSARNIVVTAGQSRLINGIDIDVPPGQLTVLIGPNGAGKSTLLKVLCGDIIPQTGHVTFDGKSLADWDPNTLARQRAVLPQAPELAFHFRVGDVVALGRHPHIGRSTTQQHRHAIDDAMCTAGVKTLSKQDCQTLSGGERHRTHYARVLAQLWDDAAAGKFRALLLDEPTTGLDLFHQHAILGRAHEMANNGIAVLAVLHDLNLAAAYADRIILLQHGQVTAAGTPAEVLTRERIAAVWQVDCDILTGTNAQLFIVTRQRSAA